MVLFVFVDFLLLGRFVLFSVVVICGVVVMMMVLFVCLVGVVLGRFIVVCLFGC